jgi:Holliday junction resolvase RusA-like endonuclease
MNQLTFFIEGIPVPKARARVWHKHRRVGNFNFISTGSYTPDKTKTWEDHVKAQAMAEIARRFHAWEPWEKCGVELDLVFYFPMPETLKKTRHFKEVGINAFNHITKPDLDNLVKSIKDSFEGVIYKNDSQVCKGTIWKRYHESQFGVGVDIRRI